MQQEEGEGGQLSVAMDKASTVASEAQADCLLDVFNYSVAHQCPLQLDHKQQS